MVHVFRALPQRNQYTVTCNYQKKKKYTNSIIENERAVLYALVSTDWQN